MKKSILPYVLLILTTISFYAVASYSTEPTVLDKILAAFIDVEVIWIYFRNHRISKKGLAVVTVPLIYNFLYPFIIQNFVTFSIAIISHIIIAGTILFLYYFVHE